MRKILFIAICVSSLALTEATAQNESTDKKAMLRDTLDGKLDFSSFIIDAKGFLPVMMIITEQALGNIGVAFAPVFLKPKENVPEGEYAAPDITVGMAMYTGNKSWMTGMARIGSIPKAGLKYRLMAGYGDINLSFYRTILNEEREFAFSIETIPVYGSISKRIGKSQIYLGVDYLYLNSKLSPEFSQEVPDFISDKELDSQTGSLGFFTEIDKRDNIFTPDQGYRLNIAYRIDDSWTGSDYSYERLNASFNWFLPIQKNWISGLRVETQHVYDNPPFYLMPGINMRGIPAARFQGETTILTETEQRYDFNLRWSGVVFGGWARAVGKDESFSDARNIYSGGGGFRYLLARAFNIRAGVDIAAGTDGFGYYIVFGHNWNR